MKRYIIFYIMLMCACVTACEKNNKIDNETTQNNLEELYSETVNCDYTWLMPDDGYIDRSLPAAAVLENGSVITFNYDDMYRLCSLEKDGEEYAVFSWKYDTQSGKSILR